MPHIAEQNPAPAGRFRHLLIAQTAHAAGDAAVVVTLADTLFFGVPLDGARGRVALFLAVTVAPVILLTPLMAAFAARWRWAGGRAMTALALTRAGTAAGLILLTHQIWALYPLALLTLAATRVHGICKTSILPEVLPGGRRLVVGNTYSSAATGVGTATGVATSIGAAHLGGNTAALFIGVGAYGFTALACWRLPSAVPVTAIVPSPRALRRRLPRTLGAVAVATATIRAASGFLTFLLAFSFRDDPGAFAALVAAASAGGAIGSVGAPLVRRLSGGARAPAALLLITAVCIVVTAAHFTAPVAAVLAAVAAFSWSAGRVLYDAELQRRTPPADRAGYVVASSVLFEAAWLIGSGLSLLWRDTSGGLLTIGIICCCGSFTSLALVGRGHPRASESSTRSSAS